MACDLLTGGIPKDCDANAGGITKLYITDFSNISAITKDGSDVVTAITMAGSPASKFYEFVFNKNTSSFTDSAKVNVQNGSLYYEQVVTLVIPRRETAKRNILKLLMQKDLVVIAKDGNGIYWMLGETQGVLVTDLPSESGLAVADGSKYTITLTGEEPNQAVEVQEAVVLAHI